MTRALVLAFVLAAGCSSDDTDPDVAAIPCRNVCFANDATCSNSCIDVTPPEPCRLGCANNTLSCQKSCEAQFPTDGPQRCYDDCGRFGADCSNACDDDGCRMSCDNAEATCRTQCDAQYSN